MAACPPGMRQVHKPCAAHGYANGKNRVHMGYTYDTHRVHIGCIIMGITGTHEAS